jgi:hypothetical protein
MNKHLLKAFAAAAAALALTACSEAPQQATKTEEPKKEAPAKVEPVAAKTAYAAAYTSAARNWTTDLQALSLASEELPGYKNEGGKAAVWKVIFGSPSQRMARVFTYSIASAGAYTKGVSAAPPQAWGGQDLSFSQADFQTDSEAAVKAASDKAAEWLKANPDKKLSLMLGAAKQFPAPVWKVQWGDAAKGGYLVYVNATTGTIVTK